MRQWALDKFQHIINQLLFQRQAGSWERWRAVVENEKKRARINEHLQYQGLRRMALFLHGMLMKQVKSAWELWMQHVINEQKKESAAIELRAAVSLQRAYRGHAARQRVNEMRRVRDELRANEAANKLQALWRARQTRINFKKLLREKYENDAALMIQCLSLIHI